MQNPNLTTSVADAPVTMMTNVITTNTNLITSSDLADVPLMAPLESVATIGTLAQPDIDALAATNSYPALRAVGTSKTAQQLGFAQVAAAARRKNRSHLLRVTCIRTDGGTRVRQYINPTMIDEYAELMTDGILFLPVTVFFDGCEYWLADGFYRVAAALQLGREKIEAVVHQGTQREAKLYSIQANQAHGARYTNQDKRLAVETLLKDAEWGQWSNREIARLCGATEGMVRKYRAEGLAAATAKHTQTRRCLRQGKTIEMNVAGLVTKPKEQVEAPCKFEITPETRNASRNLSFWNDPGQVAQLETLPSDEQLHVVSTIAKSYEKSGIRPRSVSEVINDLNKTKEKDQREADLQRRANEALQSGVDDQFVHGDCTKVLSGLKPQSVRLLLADGPYGINFTQHGQPLGLITNDKTLQGALDVHTAMLEAIKDAMLPDSHVMLFCDKKFEPEFRQVLKEAGYSYKDSLIWDKGDAGRPIPNQASRRHERIIWFTKGNPQLCGKLADVLFHRRPKHDSTAPETTHPTPKSIPLMKELIEAVTVPGELVVDPFAGSATTLIAAKMAERRYFGVECDKEFYAQGTMNLKNARQDDQNLVNARQNESAPCPSLVRELYAEGQISANTHQATVQSVA